MTCWLEPLPLSEQCLDALLALHSEHSAATSTVEALPPAAVAAALQPEVLGALCAALGTAATPRVLWLPDGLALDCCARAQPVADAFVAVHRSRLLQRAFATALLASRGVPAEGSVAEALSTVYPRWRALHVAPAAEGVAGMVLVQRGAEALARVEVPHSAFDVLRRHLAAPKTGRASIALADGNSLALEVTPAGASLQLLTASSGPVRCDAACHGPFVSLVEPQAAGAHVHGLRALLRALLAAPGSAPAVALVEPAETTDCDGLVLLARGMGLRSPVPARGARQAALFAMLGVTVDGALPPSAAAGVSVFPLPLQSAAVCSRDCVRVLARAGVPPAETHVAALAAFALFTQFALLGAKRPRRPTLLRVPPHTGGNTGVLARAWRASALEAAARLAVPLFALEWHGREVTVRAARVGGCAAVVFADEDGPFAVGGLPPLVARGANCPHTALCTALAKGTADPAPPRVAPPAAGLRAAAARLAVLDTLACGFPQFAAHARQLRALWLHTEQRALPDSDPAAFCVACGALSHLARLPLGCNFWATVPLLPA